jgi:hypothetical protein
MAHTQVSERERFRAYPLDGALLFFQPSTGANVRVENERTRAFVRRAPRVVMFAITNRCSDSLGRELTNSLHRRVEVESGPSWRTGAQTRLVTDQPAKSD